MDQVGHHAGGQRKQAAPKLLAALKHDAQAGVELRGVALVGAVGAACGGLGWVVRGWVGDQQAGGWFGFQKA
jgi:hypothetical protein